MNRFGASYFSGCPIPLEDFLKLCHEIGLDYVEIQAEHPYSPSEINTRKIDYLKDLLSGYGLTPLLHGPVHDVNLASTKERIRSASVDITKDCIVLADALGSRDLIVHAGKCPANQVPLMLDRARKCAIKSISELAPFANDLGIGIGLENKQKGKDREVIMMVDEHVRMVSEFQHLGVFAVLDLGHAFTTGCNLVEYVHVLRDSLKEVHVHDNNGQYDDHLALGRGGLPLGEVVLALHDIRFDGPVILEVKDTRELGASLQLMIELSHI